MKKDTYFITSGLVLLIAGSIHASRVILDWKIFINGDELPLYASVILAVLGIYLGYTGLKLGK